MQNPFLYLQTVLLQTIQFNIGLNVKTVLFQTIQFKQQS